MDRSQQQQRTKDHLYSDIFHTKYGESTKVNDRGIARKRQPEDVQYSECLKIRLKIQGNEYEMDDGCNPRQKGAFKESYENTLTHHQKGRPSDPAYYSKLSVKSIKDSLLKSKANQPIEPVVPDPRFRMFKHRGRHCLDPSRASRTSEGRNIQFERHRSRN